MKIKKILKKAAIIISVLLLAFKGSLMYRNYTSYQDVIHYKANQIVKVNIDGIAQSLVLNAIANPSFYLKSKREKDTIYDDDDKQKKGFNIPANIFLYTVKGQPITTVFTSLKISEQNTFKGYLKANYRAEDFKDTQNFTVATVLNNSVVIAFNKTQAVIAYNPSKDDVNQVFEDILVNHKTLEKSDVKWEKLQDADGHLNYLTKTDHLAINFQSGKAVIQGDFVLPVFLDTPKVYKSTNFSKDASVTFNLNLLSTLKYVSFKHKNQAVDTDSLDTYYKGHMALEIAKSTTQLDSVITYEYNDDFEKVETLTTVTKQVPEINLQLTSDASKLYKYLEKIAIVKDGKLSKDIFPLYQVKIDSTNAKSLQASTNLSNTVKSKLSETSEVFALKVNFERLQKQNHFPLLNSYLEKLTTLKIVGNNSKNETIAIDGQFNLKNEDINALAQFFINQKE
tara:strand:+ start:167996 stop:169354 length:1359 start_codon:yes stop_codon:yes gene_type:complete